MVSSVTATTIAQTATTLKEQFMAKTINIDTYKSSVASQVTSQIEGNESFKDIANEDAIDTIYAVISHAKTSTAETPDENTRRR